MTELSVLIALGQHKLDCLAHWSSPLTDDPGRRPWLVQLEALPRDHVQFSLYRGYA